MSRCCASTARCSMRCSGERADVRQYLELQNRHRHLQHFFRQFNVFTQLPPEALAELLARARAGRRRAGRGDHPRGRPARSALHPRGRPLPGPHRHGRPAAQRRLHPAGASSSASCPSSADHPREATVEAVTPCRLLRLTREIYADLLERYPNFRESIEERIEQYDFRHTAQIPIDFYREMLPADASVQEKVGESQVDQTVEMRLPEPGAPAAPRPSVRRPPGPAKRPSPTTRDASSRAAGGSAASPTSGRSTRWTAGPPASPSSAATSASRSAWPGSASWSTPPSTAPASRPSARAPTSSASPPVRSRPRCPASTRCRSRRSSTGKATTGWCSTTWTGPTSRCPIPAVGKRRITREELGEKWSGYAALFDYTDRLREERGGPARRRLADPLLPALLAVAGPGRGAGPDRERAADGGSGLHPDHRGPGAGRAGHRAAQRAHRRAWAR